MPPRKCRIVWLCPRFAGLPEDPLAVPVAQETCTWPPACRPGGPARHEGEKFPLALRVGFHEGLVDDGDVGCAHAFGVAHRRFHETRAHLLVHLLERQVHRLAHVHQPVMELRARGMAHQGFVGFVLRADLQVLVALVEGRARGFVEERELESQEWNGRKPIDAARAATRS
jgi:hypothetical protein